MEGANDPIYITYFMVDWKNVAQSPSDDRCITCGGAMFLVEPITSKRGVKYEGRVCHNCKSLYWVRKD